MLLVDAVILSGEYAADGLGFEGEESSMSLSEFRWAVYSGSVWNEWVELDDENEGLWLSILKYYIVICSSFFNQKIH